MTKGRDNAAESLGDVVELVRIGRHSGLLSVERIQGGRFEEGEIYFQAGQPTYARAGQMAGQEALIWLLSWHQVYFTFLANDPPPKYSFCCSRRQPHGCSGSGWDSSRSPNISSGTPGESG
jgi:hypothetical protein